MIKNDESKTEHEEWDGEHREYFPIGCENYNLCDQSGKQLAESQKINNSFTPRPRYTTYATPGHIPNRCSNISQGHLFNYANSFFINRRTQKVETTRISFKRGMDKENVVPLHNSLLLNYYKQEYPKIYKLEHKTRTYHPEWSKSDQIGHDGLYPFKVNISHKLQDNNAGIHRYKEVK